MDTTASGDLWVYHERQQALLCGQHALNNLAQANLFSLDHLATVANTLDEMERSIDTDYKGGSHMDDAGNFSIEVLKRSLVELLGITLVLRHAVVAQKREITELQGFLCHKSDHWFAIRKVGGRFWNLNSTLERPELVSHFTLGSEMEVCEQQGYTVFCVESGLPEGGEKHADGAGKNWHLISNLLKGVATEDHWEGVDGKGRILKTERTEEELLQMAMQQSLKPQVPVPDEPPAGEGVRIQFRLSGQARFVRRFRESDRVSGIYAFCESKHGPVELKSGFPPRDLSPFVMKTIAEAQLANGTIQGKPLQGT